MVALAVTVFVAVVDVGSGVCVDDSSIGFWRVQPVKTIPTQRQTRDVYFMATFLLQTLVNCEPLVYITSLILDHEFLQNIDWETSICL